VARANTAVGVSSETFLLVLLEMLSITYRNSITVHFVAVSRLQLTTSQHNTSIDLCNTTSKLEKELPEKLYFGSKPQCPAMGFPT
jgi:hypothetical protein